MRRIISMLPVLLVMVALLVMVVAPAFADSTRVCNNRCGEVDQSTTNNIDNSQDNDTTIDQSQDNDVTANQDNDITNNTNQDNDVNSTTNTTNNTTNNIENTTDDDVCTITGPGGGSGGNINC